MNTREPIPKHLFLEKPTNLVGKPHMNTSASLPPCARVVLKNIFILPKNLASFEILLKYFEICIVHKFLIVLKIF